MCKIRELWSTGWDAYCTLGRGWEGSAPPGASSFGLSPFPSPTICVCPLPLAHPTCAPYLLYTSLLSPRADTFTCL